MTERDAEVLETIRDFIRENNHAPTVRELAQLLDMASTASVFRHLLKLRKVGRLLWETRKKRSFQIIEVSA